MDPRDREPLIDTKQNDDMELANDEMQALALAYAKYLAEHGMEPGEPTFTSDEEVMEAASGKEPPGNSDSKSGNTSSSKKSNSKSSIMPKLGGRIEPTEEQIRAAEKTLERSGRRYRLLSAPVTLHDRVQGRTDGALAYLFRDIALTFHRITSSYRQSRRAIGTGLLIMSILAVVILAVFDGYTVYQYAYNGKVMGYVRNQEDVTDVLDVAGTMLSENSSGGTEIRFTANQNVTFKTIDSRGKSIDDADTAVNKLVYMTDIETEAYGIYDGDKLSAVVKSSEDAENLLNLTRDELSAPDEGMKLVSSEFTNDLAIRPINVLLTSVQSNAYARELMVNGGSTVIYHIVEEGEDIESLAETFAVDPMNIYDEDNKNIVKEVSQGDKICVHEEVEPVGVKMVETGKMKEILEFETIKKESEDYYKGDTHVEQEGVDGVQIFDGTITKVSGEVTKRDERDIQVITKKKDKIILVGTAERPKTAPTGTFIVPLTNYEGITSPFGYRWGRLHSGIDMGASHGTPIYAADGGTVIMARWYYGYGNCIDIDHGNGRVTRYGHCSKLLVNAGDQVYQGQNIALVGNTGHSFGNHLHFEVQINGTPVNPRPYLGI